MHPPQEIEQLITIAHRMGQGYILGLPGSSSVAFKNQDINSFGFTEPLLWINREGSDIAELNQDDFICLSTELIQKSIASARDFTHEELDDLLLRSRLHADNLKPPISGLIHSSIQFPCSIIGQFVAIQAIASSPNGNKKLGAIFNQKVPVLEYQASELILARLCQSVLTENPATRVMIIQNFGVVAFGVDPHEAFSSLQEISSKAEKYLKDNQAWIEDFPKIQKESGKTHAYRLAKTRKSLSGLNRSPLLLSCELLPGKLANSIKINAEKSRWKFVPYPKMASSSVPFLLIGNDLEYSQQGLYNLHGRSKLNSMLTPFAIVDDELGLCIAGRSGTELHTNQTWVQHALRIIWIADALGGYSALPEDEYLLEKDSPRPDVWRAGGADMFQGEIALVTGGASGIGKACVNSLLARGAAVVAVDINPHVTELHSGFPGYLGLVCDITDEAAVVEAFQSACQSFGGLDMLVLNAGVFPSSQRIDQLSGTKFREILQINLDANLTLLREAYPLLKEAPRNGRVVINASKNVLAPGAGAAAYSISKAGLTQLGRVALLEWSSDRIRINTVHPDAIFDTGIWSEEVLQKRAAHYGLTVQQYKTRNLLGVELNSHDVAELIAEMLGPLFEKITGAQIPVDGGSDRVI
jgi:NAD(P)-dependent dehydrogenase (short-subunit alcohol dehydrogenase family)/rhamnose utilization protein RhaD (predicted bifunctional aldolase and dehydrogenase)